MPVYHSLWPYLAQCWLSTPAHGTGAHLSPALSPVVLNRTTLFSLCCCCFLFWNFATHPVVNVLVNLCLRPWSLNPFSCAGLGCVACLHAAAKWSCLSKCPVVDTADRLVLHLGDGGEAVVRTAALALLVSQPGALQDQAEPAHWLLALPTHEHLSYPPALCQFLSSLSDFHCFVYSSLEIASLSWLSRHPLCLLLLLFPALQVWIWSIN